MSCILGRGFLVKHTFRRLARAQAGPAPCSRGWFDGLQARGANGHRVCDRAADTRRERARQRRTAERRRRASTSHHRRAAASVDMHRFLGLVREYHAHCVERWPRFPPDRRPATASDPFWFCRPETPVPTRSSKNSIGTRQSGAWFDFKYLTPANSALLGENSGGGSRDGSSRWVLSPESV